MRIVYIIVISLVMANISYAEEEELYGFSEFESISQIPEPMIYDLVRALGAKKGEYELNALIRSEQHTRLHETHVSPEFEYVFADHLAGEVELPMTGSNVDSLKGALQWTFNIFGSKKQFAHGLQFMTEKHVHQTTATELTPLFLHGHRLSKDWSYLAMMGGQYSNDKNKPDFIPVLNFTIFYLYSESKEIEFGLEQNLFGASDKFEFYRIVPQMEIILRNHLKMQLGFGGLYTKAPSQWEVTSDFRIISEFY